MNSHQLFYNEDRANKGIKRDVKDVIGEITRLELRKQIELTRETRAKTIHPKKMLSGKDAVSLKPNFRSNSTKRAHKKISYAESDTEDEIIGVDKNPFEHTNKKSKNSSKSESSNESSKDLISYDSKRSVSTSNFDKRKEDNENYIYFQQSLLEQEEKIQKQNEKTTRLEKLLEESQEIVALLLKNQAEKANKSDTKTNPIVQENMSNVTSIFGSKPTCSATLPQVQYNSQSSVTMTNKEFYLYHALQEKSRQCENDFLLSTERMRQCAKDSAEREMLFQLMCNRM